MRFRLAIIQSHPIQYFSPWFRALASRPELELKVFYCLQPTPKQQGDNFGVNFEWDVPLLEGYAHEFLPNCATGLAVFRLQHPQGARPCCLQAIRCLADPGLEPQELLAGDTGLLALPRPHVRAR
jgi:hypothetical protein